MKRDFVTFYSCTIGFYCAAALRRTSWARVRCHTENLALIARADLALRSSHSPRQLPEAAPSGRLPRAAGVPRGPVLALPAGEEGEEQGAEQVDRHRERKDAPPARHRDPTGPQSRRRDAVASSAQLW